MLDYVAVQRQLSKINADNLFAEHDDYTTSHPIKWRTPISSLDPLTILIKEKDSLGLFVSGNPLEQFVPLQSWLREFTYTDNLYLVLTGSIKKIYTKAGSMMFAMQLYTSDQELEGIIFPKIALQYSEILEEHRLYWCRGSISKKTKRNTKSSTELLDQLDTTVTAESRSTSDTAIDEQTITATVDDDIPEYEELPKLLIDSITQFSRGVQGLFEDTHSLSKHQISILNHIPWSEFLRTPTRITSIINDVSHNELPKTSTISQRNACHQTVTIRIPKSAGPELLKVIKQHASSHPGPEMVLVELWIEHGNEYKKVKGPLHLPHSIIYQIQQTIHQ